MSQATNRVSDPAAAMRRGVYFLLAAISVGLMLGRILAVDSVDAGLMERYRLDRMKADLATQRETLQKSGLAPDAIEQTLAEREKKHLRSALLRRPFLSANDRSRWCAMRALVEDDMQVDGAPMAIDKVVLEPNWDTIDMVKHDGHLYSSKPTLYPILLAAPYWVIYKTTGATLGTHPYAIGRTLLTLANVVPLAVFFWLVGCMVERFGKTDWGRIFVFASAAFGTFLTTFSVVVNNHVPAAVCAMIAMYAALRIWFDGERRLSWFALAGVFAALAATDELPALALTGALGAALLWRYPRPTLVAFAPGVLCVAAAFFATNWAVHQSLRPPYMHRSATNPDDNWYRYSYERNGKQIRSYWENPQGVDRGEPSRVAYAFHVLVGHHGIFSLTPIWLLSLLGVGMWLFHPNEPKLRDAALAVAAISAVIVVFYIMRPLEDRNYGGVTCGLRWAFWLAPLWLLTLLPAADALASRRWSRGLALVCLALSVLSAGYPTWNPWTHPWLYNYWHYLGWL
jgi:hypothetical protein